MRTSRSGTPWRPSPGRSVGRGSPTKGRGEGHQGGVQAAPGEVSVSRHFPEAFLIKFKFGHHCSAALQKGKAAATGVEVFFTKWWSLQDAEGAALLFRVRLCLDGVPMHAWRTNIAERIIGSNCALEGIDTNLDQPEETKTINLWAWMANPSSIPKCVWLTFTGRARDARLEAVLVSSTPPERWQRGVKHCVIVHLEEIQDYMLASVNLDDRTSCTPAIRRLPWLHRRGDNAAPGCRARGALFLATMPGPFAPCRSEAARERQRRGYNNDHPSKGESWRRRKDDDNDRDHHGGDRARREHEASKHTDGHGGEGYREWERSPRPGARRAVAMEGVTDSRRLCLSRTRRSPHSNSSNSAHSATGRQSNSDFSLLTRQPRFRRQPKTSSAGNRGRRTASWPPFTRNSPTTLTKRWCLVTSFTCCNRRMKPGPVLREPSPGARRYRQGEGCIPTNPGRLDAAS